MRATFDGVSVSAITSALPASVFPVEERLPFWDAKRVKRTIASTGVETVRIATAQQTAADLCVAAAERLITVEQVDRASIDALVFVSMSPDFKAPPTSVLMQDRLGLSREVVAFDINYGCSAFVYGLYQSVLLLNGGCERVLCCCGDTTSKFIHPNDGALVAIGGDAGTATLLSKGEDSFSFNIRTDGSGYRNLIIPAGGARCPHSPETAVEEMDNDGNIRTQNDLAMDGMGVMRFVLEEVPSVVAALLDDVKWRREEVGVYAMHQPNKMILQFLQDALGADNASLPIVLGKTGNVGAGSVPLLLTLEHERLGCERRLERVVAAGFGVGLSWGAVSLDLSRTHIYDPVVVD